MPQQVIRTLEEAREAAQAILDYADDNLSKMEAVDASLDKARTVYSAAETLVFILNKE